VVTSACHRRIPESECRQRVEHSIRARRSVRRAGSVGRAPGCGRPAGSRGRSAHPRYGWWPAASAAEATSLTNTMARAKSSHTKVLTIWSPRRSQPGRRCRPSATAVSSSRGMAPPSREDDCLSSPPSVRQQIGHPPAAQPAATGAISSAGAGRWPARVNATIDERIPVGCLNASLHPLHSRVTWGNGGPHSA
jgi:hypothetical protein